MTTQTRARENAHFNFSHIEPRSMNGRVMKAYPAHDPIGLKDTERLDEGLIRVLFPTSSIHQGLGIAPISQIAHHMGKIGFGAAFGEPDLALADQRFDHPEQIARAAPPIFVIWSTGMVRAQRSGRPTIHQQLVTCLIEADDRIPWIVRPGVQGQKVIHSTQD